MIKKRLATGLAAHLDNARAIARFARDAGHDVDEQALLGELAEAVGPFLEQFRQEADLDPDAELAKDVGLIPDWIANPRRGLELGRFLMEAARQDLCFDEILGEMDYHGEGAAMHDGNTPVIPLLTRVVARADAEVFLPDEEAQEGSERRGSIHLFARQKLRSVGLAHCIVCQKVGLGIVPDEERRGGLRMVFTLDPVTYVGLPIESGNDASWMTRVYSKTLVHNAIPIPGRPARAGDDGHWFETLWPERYLCPEFEAFVGRVYNDDQGWDEEQLWSRRWLPVTPETCALILGEANRHLIEVWRTFGELVEETTMPEVAVTDTGIESRAVRDRFAALLYATEEPSVAGLLMTEAEKRTDAFERFTIKTATGERRRKLAFRARMRR